MNYKEQLNKIESTINERKLELAKLDQQKTTAKEEETKLLNEFKERGVPDMDKLPTIIEEQKTKLETTLKELGDKLNV